MRVAHRGGPHTAVDVVTLVEDIDGTEREGEDALGQETLAETGIPDDPGVVGSLVGIAATARLADVGIELHAPGHGEVGAEAGPEIPDVEVLGIGVRAAVDVVPHVASAIGL